MLWWIIIGPLRRIAVQEYERSQTIVANAGEGIFTFDVNHVIVSCNRAGAELFGGDAEHWIGKSMRLAIPTLPVSFDSLPVEQRLDGVRKDGGSFPIHVSISEYPSENQNLSIMIVRDLTESQAAEKEKIAMAREAEALRAQQMATLAQLATGVAHEIRNPLTSIKMLVQVNRAKFKEEGLPTSDMELVEQEIRRMERSINHLLDYARPEKSELRKFPVQQAVEKTIQLIEGRCNAQQVSLHAKLPDAPLAIVGDPEQIQQLLLNLSLNALDAMPDGGDMHIDVAREDDQVSVIVTDTGDGISEQMLDKLFTPFVTTKPNGVGLGLGICRRIASAHGGTLEGANLQQGGPNSG